MLLISCKQDKCK